jgi:hypothetical protein
MNATMPPLMHAAAAETFKQQLLSAAGDSLASIPMTPATAAAIFSPAASDGLPTPQIKELMSRGHSIAEIAAALNITPHQVIATGINSGLIDPLEITNTDYKRFILTNLIKESLNPAEPAAVRLKATAALTELTQVSEDTKYRVMKADVGAVNQITIVVDAIEQARLKSATRQVAQLAATGSN